MGEFIAMIYMKDVSKVYDNGTVALDHVNVRIEKGDFVFLVGASGAGKSTFVRMLLREILPTSGSLRVNGHDMMKLRPKDVPYMRRGLGVIFQDYRLLPDKTVYENVAFAMEVIEAPRRLMQRSVNAVLDIVGLTDADGKRARQYSLGMKPRLGIAMALISGPELLLLDEPTNGLDPAGVAEIRNLIVRLAHDRGITVMVSSHLLSEIEQMADIVGIIQSGHLRYQGPLSGLRDQGQLVMKVSPVNAAVAHLEALGLRPQSVGDEVILPPLRDDLIAEAVARLVGAGVRIARVELRRKSLEEAFLELTETPVVMPTAPQTTGRRGRA